MALTLLGEWGFLDNLNDTSGNNRHGTLGAGAPTYVTGPQPGTRGLKFSSTSDYVSFARTGLEPATVGLTVMGWVKFDDGATGLNGVILNLLNKARAVDSSRSRMGFVYTTSTNIRQRAGVARWKDSLNVSDAGTTWTNPNWHHLAIVDGNTRYAYYVDGVQESSIARSGLPADPNTTWENFPWVTGRNNTITGDLGAHPNLSVSGIRIFQGEASTAEIAAWRDTPITAAVRQLKIGVTDVTKMYVGATPVSGIYLGSTKVWSQ